MTRELQLLLDEYAMAQILWHKALNDRAKAVEHSDYQNAQAEIYRNAQIQSKHLTKLRTAYLLDDNDKPIRHTTPQIIQRYNNLLNERKSLSTVTTIYPYRGRWGTYRGGTYHRRRINQLKRQVEKNIKRVENIIEKVW